MVRPAMPRDAGAGGWGGIGWGDSWPPAEHCSYARVAAKEKVGSEALHPAPVVVSLSRTAANPPPALRRHSSRFQGVRAVPAQAGAV